MYSDRMFQTTLTSKIISATGEDLIRFMGGGMVNQVPPFSCEYDVVGVENWEGNLITKNRQVWYIFELTNSVFQEAALDITFSTLVSYSVDLGLHRFTNPVKSRLQQLGSNPFLSATQCPVSGHFLFNESVRAANKRVTQKMNRATKERALD